MYPRTGLQTISLLVLALCYLTMVGGGTYEQLNVSRLVASNPPESLRILTGDYRFSPILFWIIFRPLTIILFLLCIFIHRKFAEVRRALIIAFTIDILVTAWTFLYFAPETEAIINYTQANISATEMTGKIRLWYQLNYLRLLAFYGAAFWLLVAIYKNGTSAIVSVSSERRSGFPQSR